MLLVPSFVRFCDLIVSLHIFLLSVSCLVMSNSLQPHGLWPSRFLCPWNFPSKNSGVGCHFLLLGHIYTLMYDICFSLSDLLHCVWDPWFLNKLKTEPPYNSAIPLLGICPEKTRIQKDTCTLMLPQHFLQQPGHGSNIDAHQQMNGQESGGTYTQRNITQPLKKIHLNQF